MNVIVCYSFTHTNMKVIHMAVIEINKDNFESEFLNSGLPVVMDFWGPQCGPCMAMMPKYHELADNPKYQGKVKFCSTDTSKNRRTAVNMKVMSLPAFVFYKDGKEAGRLTGNKATIESVRAKVEEIM